MLGERRRLKQITKIIFLEIIVVVIMMIAFKT